jgi:thymidylate synthase ThyX
MGIFGNGRAFEYLLTKMNAHPMPEMQSISSMMYEELGKVIPSFIKRSHPNDKYGGPTIDFIKKGGESVRNVARVKIPEGATPDHDPVTLTDYDADAEIKIVSGMLYKDSEVPLTQIKDIVGKMSSDEKTAVIREFMQHRKNRRNKAPRSFENAYYTFDILGNYGGYRDLQRHRVLSQERQNLTVKHGYDMPKELIEAGFESDFRDAMSAAADTHNKIYKEAPFQAQYVVPFAYRLRWYMKMNLRELYHFAELRTTPQGHPDYRKLAQKMYLKVKEVHPALVGPMKFVDMKEYDLERLEAEKRLEKKLEAMKKSGKNGS